MVNIFGKKHAYAIDNQGTALEKRNVPYTVRAARRCDVVSLNAKTGTGRLGGTGD